MTGEPQKIVGRDAELASIAGFLDKIATGPVACVIEGDAGIGKTTLWSAGIMVARARGFRILSARPLEPDSRLSYAGLGDLLDGVVEDVLSSLPEPQRKALSVALLLQEPDDRPADPRAVSVAALEGLRTTARQHPTLLAIDDLQWMDAPSRRLLQFALRRLRDEPVGLLVTDRSPPDGEAPFGVDGWLPADRIRRLTVAPLSLAGLHELIRTRVEGVPPRRILRELHRISGGNPFFALEIAHVLDRRDGAGSRPDEYDLPVPANVLVLVRDRLAGLGEPARDLLRVISALARPTVRLLEKAITGADTLREALREAVRAGVVEVEGDRVRLSHPLLGSVVSSDAPLRRQELHRLLAQVVTDPEERARHLAVATDGADPDVALMLEDAATLAHARGAPETAAELLERARDLTPEDDRDAAQRRGAVAGYFHFEAGDSARAKELLEEAAARMRPGPDRARALRTLGMVSLTHFSVPVGLQRLEEAGEEPSPEPRFSAELELDLALASVTSGDIPRMPIHAEAAVRRAEALGDPSLLGAALGYVVVSDLLMGKGTRDDLIERALELGADGDGIPTIHQPRMLCGVAFKWSERFDLARVHLTAAHRLAIEQGQGAAVPWALYHLAELECWAGNWSLAERYAAEGDELAEVTGQGPIQTVTLFARALVDAHLGRIDRARALASRGLALAQESGCIPGLVLNTAALGFMELSTGRPANAHAHLGPLADLVLYEGREMPRESAVVRFLPDEIEALIELGQHDRALALIELLDDGARTLDRHWGIAAGARCRALVLAATGDPTGAEDAIRDALEHHEGLSMPFELGRTLLSAGQVHRRGKRLRMAREVLERSLDCFVGLGAPLWAGRARAELAQIGGKAAPTGALTPAEERVADLVADGLTNREVAGALFITVNTVQTTLKHVYQKLGVHSRVELSRNLVRTRQPAR